MDNQKTSVQRKSGWYRVKYFGSWVIAKYYAESGIWRMLSDKFLSEEFSEIDETPINPEPEKHKALSRTVDRKNVQVNPPTNINRDQVLPPPPAKVNPEPEESKSFEEMLGLNHPWPFSDVLNTLIESTNILLHDKNYDGHGWENISLCVDLGLDYLKALSGATQKHFEASRSLSELQEVKQENETLKHSLRRIIALCGNDSLKDAQDIASQSLGFIDKYKTK